MKNILDEQFELSYYVRGMTYTDTENMAVFERKQMFTRLLKRKQEEKDQHDKAVERSNKISQVSKPAQKTKKR